MTDLDRILADTALKKVTPKILNIVEHRSLPLVIEPTPPGEKNPLQREFDLKDSEFEEIMDYLEQNFGNHEVKPNR
jgi:hypothetical protein